MIRHGLIIGQINTGKKRISTKEIYLITITDTVTITVPVVWGGAKDLFRQIIQPVTIRIEPTISY